MSRLFSSLFLFLLFVISHVSGYTRPERISPELWNELSAYFLPEDHPIKPNLDKIFTEFRVTSSTTALKCAGFKKPHPQPYTSTIVTKHPEMKGYIFKLYLDTQPKEDWRHFLTRIHGSNVIREAINQHQYNHIFKVPQKWLYPLPLIPAAIPGTYGKDFILVAENMRLIHEQDNYSHWRSINMTQEKVYALFVLVNELGLHDSLTPRNVCFCKDGLLAFVDTEQFHRWPINWQRALRHLHPAMRLYWTALNQG